MKGYSKQSVRSRLNYCDQVPLELLRLYFTGNVIHFSSLEKSAEEAIFEWCLDPRICRLFIFEKEWSQKRKVCVNQSRAARSFFFSFCQRLWEKKPIVFILVDIALQIKQLTSLVKRRASLCVFILGLSCPWLIDQSKGSTMWPR